MPQPLWRICAGHNAVPTYDTPQARENPHWGYQRLVGECAKLSVTVSATSVRNILRRHRLRPAPRRGGPTWTQFLRAQADGVL
jgi:hypothetical protein